MSERRIPAEVRRFVIERARECCEYYLNQADYSIDSFAVEHILARVRGGTSTPDNLALACQGCNNHKYDRATALDPLSKQQAPLYHPRRDRWEEHFAWSDDLTLLIGLTPTGRATIAALFLNRAGVVNLRRLLVAAGKHPPQR
jgi:hypothetical protein